MSEMMCQYLRRFIDLSLEELALINQFAELRHFDKKVRLVSIGEPELYVNFVLKGVIKKFFYRFRNEEVITQIAKEGEVISSSVAFFSGALSEYVVETLEPSSVISFSRESIDILYSKNFKLERLGRLIILDMFLKKEQLEYARIKLSPKQRFLSFISDNPDLLTRVPQKSLASYLNIKPETFSRYKHLITQKSYIHQP